MSIPQEIEQDIDTGIYWLKVRIKLSAKTHMKLWRRKHLNEVPSWYRPHCKECGK